MDAVDEIKFDEKGLVPVVAQDADTGQVLMLAYMNREALLRTVESGFAHFYSRSRRELWKKGETSGNLQEVKEIIYDCDEDAILLKVRPEGPACHTGEMSCFFRTLAYGKKKTASPPHGPYILDAIYQVILERKKRMPEGSYVASLFNKGAETIYKKVGEEALEAVLAAREEEPHRLAEEMADLWFHSLVLLAQRGVTVEEVYDILSGRYGKRGLKN